MNDLEEIQNFLKNNNAFSINEAAGHYSFIASAYVDDVVLEYLTLWCLLYRVYFLHTPTLSGGSPWQGGGRLYIPEPFKNILHLLDNSRIMIKKEEISMDQKFIEIDCYWIRYATISIWYLE